MLCRLIGGYSGEHGTVTAYKKIVLPFAPFAGLELVFDAQEWVVEVSSDCFPLSWNVNDKEWFLAVDFRTDRDLNECKSIGCVVEWFESHGWLVEEFEDSTETQSEKGES